MLRGTSPGSRRGVSALIAELLARADPHGHLSIPLLLPASRTLLEPPGSYPGPGSVVGAVLGARRVFLCRFCSPG